MRRPRRRRGQDRHSVFREGERGSSTIELVIVFPIVLLLLFIGMQGALLYQAKATALAAAQDGARTAAGYGMSDGEAIAKGRSAAQGFVAASALGAQGSNVSGSRTETEATFQVSIKAQSVVPLISPTITQSASMPVERITG